jgi:hypothetical protein
METVKAELKERLSVYRTLDDQLRDVNKVAHDLRQKRKIVEFEMADILKSPILSQVGDLEHIQRDGLFRRKTFKIILIIILRTLDRQQIVKTVLRLLFVSRRQIRLKQLTSNLLEMFHLKMLRVNNGNFREDTSNGVTASNYSNG